MGNNWPKVKLGEVLRLDLDRVPVDPAVSYPMVGVLSFGKGLFEREPIENGKTSYKIFYRLKAEHVVMSQLFGWEGALALSSAQFAGKFLSPQFPTFCCDTTKLDRKFLGWLMRRPSFWDDLGSRASGMGDRRRTLNPDALYACEILLPPLEDQRRIVARIEELAAKIEEARGLRKQAVEESESLVPAALSHIFDYERSDALPKAWRWMPFVALLSSKKNGMITGPFGTLLQKADVLPEGTPILGISNVEANRFVPGFNDFVGSDKADELANYRLEPEDIVIARSGTVGRSCLIPEGLDPKPIMSTNLIRVRLNKQVFLPTLLCMLFNGSKLVEQHKDSECRGSSRAFFTQKILFRLEVPTPPIGEQPRIIAYLDNLQKNTDALKTTQAEASAELDALMPSILDKAFRGEL